MDSTGCEQGVRFIKNVSPKMINKQVHLTQSLARVSILNGKLSVEILGTFKGDFVIKYVA
jgi:hypothetical protein